MQGNPFFGSSPLSLGYDNAPKRKRLLTSADKKRIAARQGYKCAECKITFGAVYHVDHIERFSDGGSDKESNLQALCPNCHSEKTENERHRIKQKKITAREKKPAKNPLFGGGPSLGSFDIGISKRKSPSFDSLIGGPNLFGESKGRRKKPRIHFRYIDGESEDLKILF